jgi:hypothetical protein
MKQLLILFLIVITGTVSAQAPYGNEWIDYSQQHYKFKVTSSGMYRIPYSALQALPGIASVSVDDITLFARGKAVPIYVTWTGAPTASDFIEFYVPRIDGSIDEKLYQYKEDMINPFIPLFSDTVCYYLTFRNAPNPRIYNAPNDLTALPAKEPWFVHTTTNIYASGYCQGRRFYVDGLEYVVKPGYDVGEGWSVYFQNAHNSSLSTPFISSIAPIETKLSTRIMCNNMGYHNLRFNFNSSILKDSLFELREASELKPFEFKIPSQNLSSNNSLDIVASFTKPHGYNISFISLTYPRDFNFGGANAFDFMIKANNTKQYLEIANFGYNTSNPIMYDFGKGQRIVLTKPVGAAPLKVALNDYTGDRNLYLFNEDQYKTITSLTQKLFTNYTLPVNQGDFIIIYPKKLTNDGLGNNRIQDYKAYRESAAGGSRTVATVLHDELYEQFGFGIVRNPLGIRKFLQFAHLTWANTPKHVLLIGKGRSNNELRIPGPYPNILLPTMGMEPSLSDQMLAVMDTSEVAFMAIGRIAAETGDEVNIYLNKVKEYEADLSKTGDPYQTTDEKDTKKWAIHLGGGSGQEQQNNFKGILRDCENKFRNIYTGGNVYGLYKNSTQILTDVTTTYLKNLINKGVQMITFFGHSAPNVFDVTIEEPDKFNNKGKYPFFLANGCNAGYIFGATKSYSENYVLKPNKGAIAFLATGNFSYDEALGVFTSNFYTQMTIPSYGMSYGDITKNTTKSIVNGSFRSIHFHLTTAQEFVFHGDPAIMPPHAPRPDYNIEPANYFFTPNIISTNKPFFKLNLVIHNLGKAINDSIIVTVTRKIGNFQYQYNQKVKAPLYMDTVSISMKSSEAEAGLGINDFDVFIESEERLAEMSETNNKLIGIIHKNIISEDILPIYPVEYGIVNKSKPILKANTSNIFEPLKTYTYEIDTTELFNSPSFKSKNISSKGGVIECAFDFDMMDSTVYYWRVKDPIKNVWNKSSFIYINNEYPGWSQSHYYQYKNDDYNNIILDSNTRQFRFVDNLKTVAIRTMGIPTANWGYGQVEWDLNNSRTQAFREGSYNGAMLNFIWIDQKTGLPHGSGDTISNGAQWGGYGSICHCYDKLSAERKGFVFPDTGIAPMTHPTRPGQPWSTVVHDFLNQIPVGDYVFMYTLKMPKYSRWDSQLTNDLLSLGANMLPQLKANNTAAPFIFGCRKGDLTFTPIQKVGINFTTITDTSFSFSGFWYTGYANSTQIGPAKAWHSLHSRYYTLDNPSLDKEKIAVYGIDNKNIETLLFKMWSNDTSLTTINAQKYPFIRLRLETEDALNRTPTQLNYWRVLYDKVPEMALNPNRFFEFSDTLDQGEYLEMKIALDNVENVAFDSVMVKYDLNKNNTHTVSYVKSDSLRGLSSNILHFRSAQPVDIGQNYISIEANPKDSGHQEENYHFNNLAEFGYTVKGDKVNPLLDVTFDGEHIINQQIISPTPFIKIKLKDENKYLALNDTNLLRVSVMYEGKSDSVYFDNTNLKFTPADFNKSSRNEAIIDFKPTFTKDGIYTLQIKDADKSGNSSSTKKTYDYSMNFRIDTKQSITQVLNYPNPFTSKTQFVFTLTGSKVPDQMQIVIMTISGKIVKVINKDDLGPLKIGVNKTQYWWDGTDTYGDMLANGVYLYKVITKDAGKEIDLRQITSENGNTITNIQKAFESGLGKMVLIR